MIRRQANTKGGRRGDLDVEFACRAGRVVALRRRRRRARVRVVVGASKQNQDAKQGSERTGVPSNHGRREVPFNNKKNSPGNEERIEEQRQDTAKSSWPLRGWLAGWATLYEKREKGERPVSRVATAKPAPGGMEGNQKPKPPRPSISLLWTTWAIMTNPPYHAPFSIWPSRILICPIWQGTRPLPVLDSGEGEIGREAAKARAGRPAFLAASGSRHGLARLKWQRGRSTIHS